MIPEHKKRLMITLDRDLAAQLDAVATQAGLHRSTLITAAVKHYMRTALRTRSHKPGSTRTRTKTDAALPS